MEKIIPRGGADAGQTLDGELLRSRLRSLFASQFPFTQQKVLLVMDKVLERLDQRPLP